MTKSLPTFHPKNFKFWRPSDATRRLHVPRWLTPATRCVNDAAIWVGRRLVPVGYKLTELVRDFYERFPHTTYAIVFFLVLAWFVARVPYAGTILAPVFAVAGLFATGLAFAMELLSSIGTCHRSRRQDRQ